MKSLIQMLVAVSLGAVMVAGCSKKEEAAPVAPVAAPAPVAPAPAPVEAGGWTPPAADAAAPAAPAAETAAPAPAAPAADAAPAAK